MEISVCTTSSNCYLVSGERGALIIDPYEYTDKIKAFVAVNADKEIAILITHGHFDHIKAAPVIRKDCGAKIYVNENDNYALGSPVFNLSSYFGDSIEPFAADVTLAHSETFNVGDIEITAYNTPGHTPGCNCYVIDDVMFTGDTIFAQSIGRTDFPTSDNSAMLSSLRFLKNLKVDYILYPGHGGKTTLFTEKKFNPYMVGV